MWRPESAVDEERDILPCFVLDGANHQFAAHDGSPSETLSYFTSPSH